MSETRLLALVARYPHLVALARHAGTEALFPLLHRLEGAGLVTGRGSRLSLTRRGRNELELCRALVRTIAVARL